MDNFSWLAPLIFGIIAILSSAAKKNLNRSGMRPFSPPPMPWARPSEPGSFGQPKWSTFGRSLRESWRNPSDPWDEDVDDHLDEADIEAEESNLSNKSKLIRPQNFVSTFGLEGSLGIEGTPGVEGTYGIEGTSGVEGVSGTEGKRDPVQAKNLKASNISNSQTSDLSLNTLPNPEDLMRAVVWAEILGKPKALRTRH